jgi:hypothetical protein
MDLEDGEGKCQECGIVTILDSEIRICFECWSALDLEQHELEVLATEEE